MHVFLSTNGSRGQFGGTWRSTVVELADEPMSYRALQGEVIKLRSNHWDNTIVYHSHTNLSLEHIRVQPGDAYIYAVSYWYAHSLGFGFGGTELALSWPIRTLASLRDAEKTIKSAVDGCTDVVLLTVQPLSVISPEVVKFLESQ